MENKILFSEYAFPICLEWVFFSQWLLLWPLLPSDPLLELHVPARAAAHCVGVQFRAEQGPIGAATTYAAPTAKRRRRLGRSGGQQSRPAAGPQTDAAAATTAPDHRVTVPVAGQDQDGFDCHTSRRHPGRWRRRRSSGTCLTGFSDHLIHLFDRLIDFFVNLWIEFSIDWLIDWLTNLLCSIHRLIDWLIDWITEGYANDSEMPIFSRSLLWNRPFKMPAARWKSLRPAWARSASRPAVPWTWTVSSWPIRPSFSTRFSYPAVRTLCDDCRRTVMQSITHWKPMSISRPSRRPVRAATFCRTSAWSPRTCRAPCRTAFSRALRWRMILPVTLLRESRSIDFSAVRERRKFPRKQWTWAAFSWAKFFDWGFSSFLSW